MCRFSSGLGCLVQLSRHELGKMRGCKVAIRKMQGRLVIVRKVFLSFKTILQIHAQLKSFPIQ